MALAVAKPKPQPVLKVIRNYTGLGTSTYNPQVTYNPQKTVTPQRLQPTYNPQQTVQARQLQQAQAAERARVVAIQQAQARAAEKKRLTDVFNDSVQVKKGNFLSTLGQKVTLASFRQQKSRGDIALKYAKKNEKSWYNEITRKQSSFEKELAQKKDWVMQSKTEAEYNRRLQTANQWLEWTQGQINKDIQDYNNTQKQLYAQANKKLTGVVPNLGRAIGVGAKALGSVGAKVFNTATAVINTPNRVINTVGNLNTPNRTVYKQGGGTTTIKGQGLKAAWNASEKQRVINAKPWIDAKFTKKQAELKFGAEAAKQAERFRKNGLDKKDKKLGTKDYWLQKYVEDYNRKHRAYNTATQFWGDPAMYTGGAAIARATAKTKGFVSNKFFNTLGKTSIGRQAALTFTAGKMLAGETKAGRAVKWLNKPHRSKNAQWLEDNKGLIQKKRALGDELKEVVDNWRDTKVQKFGSIKKQVESLTDQESELLQRYILRNQFADGKFTSVTAKETATWDNVVVPRGFNKIQRRKLEDIARVLKRHFDDLKASELTYYRQQYGDKLPRELYRYRKDYLPQFVQRGKVPKFNKFKGLKGQWWLKRKTGQTLQSTADLTNSIEKRTVGQLWRQQPEAGWLRNNAGKYVKELDDTQNKLELSRANMEASKGGKLRRGAGAAVRAPMNTWKKAVLKYRPAWYVNNTAWNIPASISAGGAGTIGQYGKILSHAIKERTLSPALLKKLPDDVASSVGQLWGFERKSNGKLPLATKLENISRSAAYMNLQKRGFGKDDALKRTNDWLFDYSKMKNIERPLRMVMPFWTWQKGLTKLAATMPFKYPRQAKMFYGAYDQFYKKPFEAIPDSKVQYTDENGQEVSYDNKARYEGKLKIGNKWYSTPFNAMTPTQLSAIGINPLLSAFSEWATSRDKYGNLNTEQNFWKTLSRTMPQYKLAENFINRNKDEVERWFSESNYSKEASGANPKAANYRAGLDKGRTYSKSWKSFLGMPSNITQDLKGEDRTRRLTAFNKKYFAIDWDKRLDQYLGEDTKTAYDRIAADKKKLAKEMGFDFDKDIAKGSWAKYDTGATKHTKVLKEKARKFDEQFWKEYNDVPKSKFIKTAKGGYWERSKKDPFIVKKFAEWAMKHTFAENAYYTIPYFNQKDAAGKKTGVKEYINPFTRKNKIAATDSKIAAGQRKYALWQQYFKLGSYAEKAAFLRRYPELMAGKARKTAQFTYNGKYFKSAASRQRYINAQRFVFNGKHFKSAESMEKYKDGQFWAKYYALTDYEARQRLLDQNPKYRTSAAPTTYEEGRAIRSKSKAKMQAKIRSLSGFTQREIDFRNKRIPAVPNKRGYKKVVFKT